MPKATTCELDGRIIGVEEAMQLRDEAKKRLRPYPQFHCRECGEDVKPHEEGTTGQAAHFEHWRKNLNCSQSA